MQMSLPERDEKQEEEGMESKMLRIGSTMSIRSDVTNDGNHCVCGMVLSVVPSRDKTERRKFDPVLRSFSFVKN